MRKALKERFVSAPVSLFPTESFAGRFYTGIAVTPPHGRNVRSRGRLTIIMKGSFLMTKRDDFEAMLRLKNREISNEREKVREKEITNLIISAYLSLLVEDRGSFRVSKEEVSRALGNLVTVATSDGDHYVITVKELEKKDEYGGEE